MYSNAEFILYHHSFHENEVLSSPNIEHIMQSLYPSPTNILELSPATSRLGLPAV